MMASAPWRSARRAYLDSGGGVRALHSEHDGQFEPLAGGGHRLRPVDPLFLGQSLPFTGQLRPHHPMRTAPLQELDLLAQGVEVQRAAIGEWSLRDGEDAPEWFPLRALSRHGGRRTQCQEIPPCESHRHTLTSQWILSSGPEHSGRSRIPDPA